MKHLYWTRAWLNNWKHSDKCHCKGKKDVDFRKMTRDVKTRWFETNTIAHRTITKEELYEVTGDLTGHLPMRPIKVMAMSEPDAMKKAVKRLENYNGFITTSQQLIVRKVEERD